MHDYSTCPFPSELADRVIWQPRADGLLHHYGGREGAHPGQADEHAVVELPVGRQVGAGSLYLAWMDCRGLEMDAESLDRFMLTTARLWLDKGQKSGTEGRGYIRVNLGCPRSTVDEAIRRLITALAGL